MAKVVLTSIKTRYTQDTIDRAVFRALNLLRYDFDRNFNLVIIKPNLCYYWDYSTGETTDPRVVSALIDYIRERVGDGLEVLIAEADATAMRTKYAFKMLGYERLSKKKKVKLFNLSEGEVISKEVFVNNKKFKLSVNKVLLESDLMINVPKLKFHRLVGITCGMKNLFGAISTPKKCRYHSQLDDTIVGINKIVKSDITLVDGVIAKGAYPKNLGVIIASDNVLAADLTAAKILGYDPREISYIFLGEREKIGDFQTILIEDETKIGEYHGIISKQNYLLQKVSWKLQLKALKIYSSITGDTIPPVLLESE